MKHVRRITAKKADVWSDISTWFEDLWSQIASFFKGE